jgi:hypothetical protein
MLLLLFRQDEFPVEMRAATTWFEEILIRDLTCGGETRTRRLSTKWTTVHSKK